MKKLQFCGNTLVLSLVFAVTVPIIDLGTVRAENGFFGDGKCGNQKCHGTAQPASATKAPSDWRPWMSARIQWHSPDDHHSHAYHTLKTEAGQAIARYMGIDSTSEKCRVCHAPWLTIDGKKIEVLADSAYHVEDGVSCEHCHGPAQTWMSVHTDHDWREKKSAYVSRGFYDNNDYKLRAENCARCHVQIDHQIVAGGHPPLQFEMVGYAKVMKHWDDRDEMPEGLFNADPTLWSLGQIVGLRKVMEMIAARAGGDDEQSIGKFSGFKDDNCSQCHHKLLADGMRQARGHYFTVDVIISVLFPEAQQELTKRWNELASALRTGKDTAAVKTKSGGLAEWLAGYEDRVMASRPNQAATREMLTRIVSSDESVMRTEAANYSCEPAANVVHIENVQDPWWYTKAVPEQAILAIESLCEPAYGNPKDLSPSQKCASIAPEMKELLTAVNRFAYDPAKFAKSAMLAFDSACKPGPGHLREQQCDRIDPQLPQLLTALARFSYDSSRFTRTLHAIASKLEK